MTEKPTEPSTLPPVEAGTVEAVQEAVRGSPPVLPRGGGSKNALSSAPAGTRSLGLGELAGVVDYLPEEYTITLRPGTRIDCIDRLLAGEGQHLPFDPLLLEAGATVGGTVAAGTNGPGRQRFGGARDFLLGVRFVDGRGRLVQGGGRVVKNAAGFDLPKLMVGSLGRLGVLVELTFKVFPAPEARRTLRVELGSVASCLERLARLRRHPLDLEAIEIEPPGLLWLRVAGRERALDRRIERLQSLLRGEGGRAAETIDLLEGEQQREHWQAERELVWVPEEFSLVKVPLTPGRIAELESALASSLPPRRYGGGGQQLLVAWPAELDPLDRLLGRLELMGLVLRGHGGTGILGSRPPGSSTFAARVKQALDPDGAFPPLP